MIASTLGHLLEARNLDELSRVGLAIRAQRDRLLRALLLPRAPPFEVAQLLRGLALHRDEPRCELELSVTRLIIGIWRASRNAR